jgi:hypothetical protein
MGRKLTDTEKAKKSTPTPKRRESESKNFRPLVIDKSKRKKLTKEEKQKRRAETAELRNKEQDALRTGDERYLPERDKGAVKRFVRNEVDSTRTLSEFFLIVAFTALVISMVLSRFLPGFSFLVTILVYVYLAVALVQMWFFTRKLKKALQEKFGDKTVVRGSGNISYAISRMMQPRFARLPKAQAKAQARAQKNAKKPAKQGTAK